MNENNKVSATDKLKSLFGPAKEETDTEKTQSDANAKEEPVVEDIIIAPADESAPAKPDEKTEIEELRKTVESLRQQLDECMTRKEEFREFTAIVNRKDSEMANRKLMGMLEQLSAMREDFFKLRNGVKEKIDRFSAGDVLDSFSAYGVDMENILVDCGVNIGPFLQYEKLNTIHQRIVDVVLTNDESKNGLIADRISDGYEYNGRVLFKERVSIYKYTETPIAATESVQTTCDVAKTASGTTKPATKTGTRKKKAAPKKTVTETEE